MEVKDEISLGFGYSDVHDIETTLYGELLEFLFGGFTQIQFHVEEFSHDVRRISVRGIDKRLPRPRIIHEHFTGYSGRMHQAKNGALLVISYDASGMVSFLKRPIGIAFVDADDREKQEAAE